MHRGEAMGVAAHFFLLQAPFDIFDNLTDQYPPQIHDFDYLLSSFQKMRQFQIVLMLDFLFQGGFS